MEAQDILQAGAPDKVPPHRRLRAAHRILVVDDDDDIRLINSDVLTHSGYHVDAAEDGAAAWDTLQRNRYDLLITDNDMPKVTGVELLHKLHAAHMALPVIMATGVPPQDEFIHYPWLQPAVLLLKPYSYHELLGAVRSVLFATAAGSGPVAPPDRQTGPPAGALRC
jgi:two-component system alkaline phosphatase synthesis response regulator PhoP